MKRTYCEACLELVEPRAEQCPQCAAPRPAAGWPDDPLMGTAVGGKYRVLRRLGREAFGVVYLAVHVELEAQRALKVLDPRLAHDERVRERFEREARALYRLEPRHIVRLEDFGEVRPGLPYMALEYVEGETLAELLGRVGRLGDPARALRLARQIAEALVDAADEGVLHRDLRPENVVLRRHRTRGDEIKVLNFGIAKILGEQTLAGPGATRQTGLLSRPEYVAPEQWIGTAPADARADLFSLGVLVYELLAGASPWPVDEGEPFAVFERMRSRPPVHLERVRRDLPEGVAPLVHRLIAVDPERRPASARALIVELDRLGLLSTASFAPVEADPVAEAASSEGAESGPEEAVPDAGTDPTARAGSATLDAEPSGRPTPVSRDAPTLAATRSAPRRATEEAVRESGADRVRRKSGPEALPEVRRPEAVSRDSRPLLLVAIALAAAAVGIFLFALFGTLPTAPAEPHPTDAGDAVPTSGTGARDGTAAASDGSGARTVHLAPEVVALPGGPARIGPSDDERRAQAARYGETAGSWSFGAARDAVLEPFGIDRYEVSEADFLTWRADLGEGEAPCGDGGWRTLLPDDDPLLPARGVSFAEAEAYCEARDGRLPTFEEWEVAARGPDDSATPWVGGETARGAFNVGSAEQPLWGLAPDSGDGYLGLAPVTALGPSGAAVVGLGGNVSEWVQGPQERGTAPPFFHRGGSYLAHPVFAQSFAYQFVADACTSYATVGFRCAYP